VKGPVFFSATVKNVGTLSNVLAIGRRADAVATG
jgi:hypothetical protein